MEYTEEELKKVKQRTEDKMGFVYHLLSYIFVNILLVAINLVSSPNEIWFIWSLGFWGIGLLAHFFSVFVLDNPLSSVEKMFRDQEMKRLRK